MKPHQSLSRLTGAMLTLFFLAVMPGTQAAELVASNRHAYNVLGRTVSQAGALSLAGAPYTGFGNRNGQACLYRNLDTAAGVVSENVRLLTLQDQVANGLGASVSLSGSTGLVGSYNNIAYLYWNLDKASGTITESARLTLSNELNTEFLGYVVGLSGGIGLVGTSGADIGDNVNQGAAYLFRNLQTASTVFTESAKLIASDGGPGDQFGYGVNVAGTMGLVDALYHTTSATSKKADFAQGAAYLYRHLDTLVGTVTEDAKLIASNGRTNDLFGSGGVSLSGNMALIGSADTDNTAGAAYLYRNLDTITGTVTESARLVPGAVSLSFAVSVCLSGSTALVSEEASFDFSDGSVYAYRNLDVAKGAIVPYLRIFLTKAANNNTSGEGFGSSVDLNGDRFMIGSPHADESVGKCYSGSLASMSTMDVGSRSEVISRVSFISQEDWIIGRNTDANQVILGKADNAQVLIEGKAVYIGKNAGSDNNVLALQGKLATGLIQVGSLAGNQGNLLRLEDTAILVLPFIRLAPNNQILIRGNYLDPEALAAYLQATQLQVFSSGQWLTVNAGNFSNLLTSRLAGGYTVLQPKSR